METDSRAHVSVLTNRLELLLAEKTASDELSREQRLRLADNDRMHAQKAADLAQAQRLSIGLVDTVRFFSTRLAQQEDVLQRHVEHWAEACDKQLRLATKKLYTATRVISEIKAGSTEARASQGVNESFLAQGVGSPLPQSQVRSLLHQP